MGEGGSAAGLSAPAGYDPVRVLGRGRLGRLVLCRNAVGDEVAVRILTARPAEEQARRQFESELRAAAAAGSHSCAAQITRVWTDPVEGTCLEQRYCAGGSVSDRLAKGGTFDPVEVILGALRLTAALARLHNSGLLHRDVRPANVLLDGDGEWRLAECGVAHVIYRATPGAGPLHEPLYAPRELLGWEDPGPPADVYALGATLYAVLAGRPPAAAGTEGKAAAEYAALLAGPAPLPPFVPSALAALVLRMLAVDPAERPTLAEVDQVLRAQVPAAQLSRVPAPEPARTVPKPPRPRTRIAVTEPDAVERSGRRRVLLAGAAVAVLFFTGAGAVVATHGGVDEDAAPLAALPTPALAATATAAPTADPEPAAGEPPPARGTPRFAAGVAVDQGLTPYRIIAFEYKGRLAALLDLRKISTDLKRLLVFSARADGSGARPGDDSFKMLVAQSTPKTIAFFFEPDVSTKRCVQVRPERREGQAFTDPRTVCVQKLSADDRALADQGWRSYQEGERAGDATKSPSPRTT